MSSREASGRGPFLGQTLRTSFLVPTVLGEDIQARWVGGFEVTRRQVAVTRAANAPSHDHPTPDQLRFECRDQSGREKP
jgi:hypothetical protein